MTPDKNTIFQYYLGHQSWNISLNWGLTLTQIDIDKLESASTVDNVRVAEFKVGDKVQSTDAGNIFTIQKAEYHHIKDDFRYTLDQNNVVWYQEDELELYNNKISTRATITTITIDGKVIGGFSYKEPALDGFESISGKVLKKSDCQHKNTKTVQMITSAYKECLDCGKDLGNV